MSICGRELSRIQTLESAYNRAEGKRGEMNAAYRAAHLLSLAEAKAAVDQLKAGLRL